jgi:hypothetical protein
MECSVQPTESTPTPSPSTAAGDVAPATPAAPQTGTREPVAGSQLVPAPGQPASALSIAPWHSTGGMISLAAVLIGGALILHARFKIARAKRDARPDSSKPRSSAAPASGTSQITTDIKNARAAAAELRQLTEELASILDAKSQHLEALIEQADQRIARLSSAAKPDKPAATTTPPLSEPARTPASSVSSVSLVSSVSSVSSHASPHAHIHALADEGLSPIDIARRTGKPTGTIELILSLRRAAAAR